MLLHYFVISDYVLPMPIQLSDEHDEGKWFSKADLGALDRDFYGIYSTLYEQQLQEGILLL